MSRGYRLLKYRGGIIGFIDILQNRRKPPRCSTRALKTARRRMASWFLGKVVPRHHELFVELLGGDTDTGFPPGTWMCLECDAVITSVSARICPKCKAERLSLSREDLEQR